MTPIDESVLSTYFAKQENQPFTNPRLSTISKVSTNEGSITTSSEQQSPASTHTIKAQDLTPARADTRKSAGGVSALGTDEPRKSTDVLSTSRDPRRDSTVSDVSSITEPDRSRRDTITENTSEPVRTLVRTNSPEDIKSQAPLSVSRQAEEDGQSPSYPASTVKALSEKDLEAGQDRQDEATLPRYQAVNPPRIPLNAQIVPIGRIQSDEETPAQEMSRPFSFVGNESVIGYGTNHSLNSTIHTNSQSGTDRGTGFEGHGESPLPSANRKPEELARKSKTAEDFARLRAQSPPIRTDTNQDAGFQIPGPYGHELRSPRQKNSSPVSNQVLRTPTATSQSIDGPDMLSTAPTGNTLTAVQAAGLGQDTTRHQQYTGPQQHPLQSAAVNHNPPMSGQGHMHMNAAPMQHSQQHANLQQPQQQQYQQYPPQQLQQHYSHFQGQPQNQQDQSISSTSVPQERENDRSRASGRFSSIFGRSAKRESQQQLPPPVMDRPESAASVNRRSGFFGGPSKSSTSIPTVQTGTTDRFPEPQAHMTPQNSQLNSGRRLSKDMLGSSSSSTPVRPAEQHLHSQVTPKDKKKRFSGFFGKSAKDSTPQRHSTVMNSPMPNQPQQFRPQTYHDQATIPAHGYQNPPNSIQQNNAYLQGQGHLQQSNHNGYVPPVQGFYGQQNQQNQQIQQPQRPSQFDSHSPNTWLPTTQPVQHSGQLPFNRSGGHSDHMSSVSSNGQYPSHTSSASQQPDSYLMNQTSQQQLYQHQQSQQFQQYPHQQSLPANQHQDRADLPKLQTRNGASSPVLPTSAPPVPAAYIHDRQNITSSRISQPSMQNIRNDVPQSQHQPPMTRANKDISYGSDTFTHPGSTASPIGQDLESKITPRVAALHTRSRSPKLGRRSTEDQDTTHDALQAQSPASALGTFSNNKTSPVGGISRSIEEQEKPWTLNLPNDKIEEENPPSAASYKAREMRRVLLERSAVNPPQQHNPPLTAAEKYMGVASRPTQNTPGVVLGSTSLGDENTLDQAARNGYGTGSNTFPTSAQPTESKPQHETPLAKQGSTNMNQAGSVKSASQAPNTASSRSVTPVSGMLTRKPTTTAAPVQAPKVLDQPDVNARQPQHSRGADLMQSPPSPLPTPAKPLPVNVRQEPPRNVYEMPGSRPDGYESEDEPIMTATSFPGQEWQPVFDRWDD